VAVAQRKPQTLTTSTLTVARVTRTSEHCVDTIIASSPPARAANECTSRSKPNVTRDSVDICAYAYTQRHIQGRRICVCGRPEICACVIVSYRHPIVRQTHIRVIRSDRPAASKAKKKPPSPAAAWEGLSHSALHWIGPDTDQDIGEYVGGDVQHIEEFHYLFTSLRYRSRMACVGNCRSASVWSVNVRITACRWRWSWPGL